VPIWDLILGAEIEVETIFGTSFAMRVPPNTQPNTVMRVRGQGMRNKHETGDLFVRLQAEIPTTIAPEIIEAIQKHR
jgi:molecular chaperone DnaJ